MYTIPQFATFVWLLAHFASQATQPDPPFVSAKDIGPVYVRPHATSPATVDGTRYEYVATKERETQIVNGFRKLKPGQSREEARKLLGLPDRVRPLYPKENPPTLIVWDYKYYIREREKNSANMSDPLVEVFFTPEGNLTEAYFQGIPELKDMLDQKWIFTVPTHSEN